MKTSIEIFKKRDWEKFYFFSYPFGEYSTNLKNIVIDLGFKYAFGQHSGVTITLKIYLKCQDFQLMKSTEKRKDLKQYLKLYLFHTNQFNQKKDILVMKTIHLKVSIQFYDNLKNLNNINCFSNEEDKWRNSKIKFDGKNNLNIILEGKFITERGRINCSLREKMVSIDGLVFNLL